MKKYIKTTISDYLTENTNNIDIKKLEGFWQSYHSGPMGGKKTDGYITINNKDDMHNYITSILGDVVKEIILLEKGKSYPYNNSNPYREDIYSVSLLDGRTFTITRIYGRPVWTGHVSYKEQIEVSNIK